MLASESTVHGTVSVARRGFGDYLGIGEAYRDLLADNQALDLVIAPRSTAGSPTRRPARPGGVTTVARLGPDGHPAVTSACALALVQVLAMEGQMCRDVRAGLNEVVTRPMRHP